MFLLCLFLARFTTQNWDWYHNAKDLDIGVSTEAGKLLDIFRFKSLEEVEEMFRPDVGRR